MIKDLRLACRSILRMPVFSAVIVTSLAIGIGVNTTIFSWMQSLVLKPLPGVRDASSFYLIEPRAETGTYPGTSWPELADFRKRLTAFESIIAARPAPFNVGCEDGGAAEEPANGAVSVCVPSRRYGLLVSGDYFTSLGLQPARGRLLAPDDASTAGASSVAVISHAFWQSQLGAAETAVGSTLRVNDRPLTIVGIAPEAFEGTASGMRFDVWVPATMAPALQAGSRELESRGSRGYAAMGRLRPGATVALAQDELDGLMRELARDYPESNATLRGEVLPFWQAPRGPRQFLIAALGVLQLVMLVLLLAICGNAATLLLARATTRVREVGVRLALGASRLHVIRLLLVESLLLAGVGAALGIAVAIWGTEALRKDIVPLTRTLPISFHSSIDVLGVLVAAALGLASGVVFGLTPALQLARLAPQLSLRPGGGAPPRSRLRDGIMATQVALAMAVTIAAGLFLQMFLDTQRIDPGFRREGVLLAAYDLRGRPAAKDARVFAADVLERLDALPAVDTVAIAASVPLDIHGLPLRFFTVEGRARPDGELDQALANTVTPGYFATMKIPIIAGADFVDLRDTNRAPEAIVNEEFVGRFLSGVDPLGRRIQSGGRPFTIAAVVADSRYESFTEPPTPIIYFSYRDRTPSQGEIHLRTREGAEVALTNDVRRVIRGLDAELPVYNVRTLSEHVDANLFMQRIPARMFAVLGPLILLMAAIGIYAVVSYAASLRTTEIGVRLALGATPRRVVTEFLFDHLRVVGWGALAGWLLVFVTATDVDPAVFTIAPAVLMTVATIACLVPARRAAAIDPIVALRQD